MDWSDIDMQTYELCDFAIGELVMTNIPKYGKNQWLNGYIVKVVGITKNYVKVVSSCYPNDVRYVCPHYLTKLEKK